MPSDAKTAIAAVFDRSAATYDQVGVDFFTPIGRDLVHRAALRPGERVLDVGCGRGAVLFAARDAVGELGAVTGIDLSAQMVALTRAEVVARGWTGVSVEVADAEEPPYPPGSFDAILAGLVIFFLPDPRAALRRYAELLADGGRLAFSTFGPNDPAFEAAMKTFASFAPEPMPDRDERQGPFATPEGIADVLRECGYRDVDTGELTYDSHFADAEHWLSWAWSHGGRALLERVPAAALAEATRAAFAALDPARSPDGGYTLRTTVRFTVARPC